jgi:hypothetical protein
MLSKVITGKNKKKRRQGVQQGEIEW